MPERNEFTWSGLDGSNPLAFLAALGSLRAAGAGARLNWQPDLRPVLHADEPTMSGLFEKMAKQLCAAASMLETYPSPAEVIKTKATDFRRFAEGESTDAMRLDFAACFGSDAAKDANATDLISPTRLSLANGQGGKKLLMHFRQMVKDLASPQAPPGKRSKSSAIEDRTLTTLLKEALIDWKRRDSKGFYSFRWDPLELRRAAHMAVTPEDDPYQPVVGANLLAFLGLTLLPSAPSASELITTCLFEVERRELFAWPLWEFPLTIDEVIALLVCAGSGNSPLAPNWSRPRGVFARFASERYSDAQKNAFFNSSYTI